MKISEIIGKFIGPKTYETLMTSVFRDGTVCLLVKKSMLLVSVILTPAPLKEPLKNGAGEKYVMQEQIGAKLFFDCLSQEREKVAPKIEN